MAGIEESPFNSNQNYNVADNIRGDFIDAPSIFAWSDVPYCALETTSTLVFTISAGLFLRFKHCGRIVDGDFRKYIVVSKFQ